MSKNVIISRRQEADKYKEHKKKERNVRNYSKNHLSGKLLTGRATLQQQQQHLKLAKEDFTII